MEEINIDIESLRRDLINYFGAATFLYPVAIMNVIEVENADCYKLIEIAKSNGFDLNDYIIEPYTKNLFR